MMWLMGGKIRWRTIRVMLDGGYIDAYRKLHKDPGFTFPTWSPHVRLDYTFLPAAFADRVTRCEIVRNAPGVREASDHFPLLTELQGT
jgi:exodeoxyribonuclease-3